MEAAMGLALRKSSIGRTARIQTASVMVIPIRNQENTVPIHPTKPCMSGIVHRTKDYSHPGSLACYSTTLDAQRFAT